MKYPRWFSAWVMVLLVLVGFSLYGSIRILHTDTTFKPGNAQEKVSLIAEALTLELLPQVVGESAGNEADPEVIADLARKIVDQVLPDVSQETKEEVSALVALSRFEAAETIRNSAEASLEKDVFGESGITGPARQKLVDSTLASLNLFEGDVTDPANLEAELAAAAAVALTLSSGFVAETERPIVQQSTVDALTFAIKSDIESATTVTLLELPDDALQDISMERLGRLDGDAVIWADITTLPIVALAGGFAAEQLISMLTGLVTLRRKPRAGG